MLNLVMPFCGQYVIELFNESLSLGEFPTAWKTALVIPIAKKTAPEELKDVRPISILPVVSKLMEKVVAEQFVDHLNDCAILPVYQSGFRAKYSTNTALLKVADDITSSLDESNITILVLADQSKAFDVVNIPLLLAKLKCVGVNNFTYDWFKTYLSDRQQLVKVEQEYSSIEARHSGVPQGSILGPILFSLFTFDLCDVFQFCQYHMYADDLQLYFSCKIDEIDPAIAKVNCDLENLSRWCRDNGLYLNPDKTVALCISGSSRRNFNFVDKMLNIGGTNLTWVDTAKNLGVYFDCNLSFEKHVDHVVRISFMKLKGLYKFKYELDQGTKLRLVKSLIYPCINYCVQVYYSHLTEHNKYRLQKVQNAAMRFIKCIQYREHITPHLRALGELTIKESHFLMFCVFLRKLCETKTPRYLYNNLIRRSDIHSVNVRQKNTFHIPKHYTKKFESSFSYIAPTFLNKCYQFVNCSEPIFKIHVRDLIFSERI